MSREKDIVVFLETTGESRDEINGKLLTEGGRVAGLTGGNLSAMAVGELPEERGMLECYGVSVLYHVTGKRLSDYSGEVYGYAAKEALKDLPFRLLLFAHTDRGSELSTRIGWYLDTAAVNECVDIRVNDGALSYVRLAYGGQFEEVLSFDEGAPEIVTIRPESFDRRDSWGTKPVPVHLLEVSVPEEVKGSKSLEIIPPDYRTVDILYAKRIIGAGSGCCEGGLLGQVEELSHLLESSVGTTRPVVDDGHLPRERMIGQTGKTVVPELYIALGISGSPHHVAGFQQTKKVFSVNVDPRAPIFNVSDTGFVCDVNSLLPKLIARIKRYRDEGLT